MKIILFVLLVFNGCSNINEMLLVKKQLVSTKETSFCKKTVALKSLEYLAHKYHCKTNK